MIQLIVNPVAGNGTAKTIGALAHEYLEQRGIEHEVRHTEYSGHATELAKDAADRGLQTVIAVGGDGTVSETGAGLMYSTCALGILAAGTGNDFLKALGLPSKWQPALELILSTAPRPVDTGIINDRFFLNVCGMGFDVMALDHTLSAKKYMKGMLPYLYGVIRAIKNFKPAPMHIEIGDEVKLDGRYMVCSVANGRFIGGGIPIAPVADVADGLFDIIVVDAVPRWKIPFYLPGLLTGKLINYKITHHYRSGGVLLNSHGMRLNLDGEVLPMEQCQFTCQKDALQVHW